MVPSTDATLTRPGMWADGSLPCICGMPIARKFSGTDGNYQKTLELPGIGTVSGFTGRQIPRKPFASHELNDADATLPVWLRHREFDVVELSRTCRSVRRITRRQVWFTSATAPGCRCSSPDAGTWLWEGASGAALCLWRIQHLDHAELLTGEPAGMEQGGLYCVPNLRGGEFKRNGASGGDRCGSRNVFDDSIGAANEWLVKERRTTPRQPAIAGGSNGACWSGRR